MTDTTVLTMGGQITTPVSDLEEVGDFILPQWVLALSPSVLTRNISDSEQWSRRGADLRVPRGRPPHLQRGVGAGGQGPELLRQLQEVCGVHVP